MNNSNHMVLMSNLSLFKENEKLNFNKSGFVGNSINPYLSLNLNSVNLSNQHQTES